MEMQSFSPKTEYQKELEAAKNWLEQYAADSHFGHGRILLDHIRRLEKILSVKRTFRDDVALAFHTHRDVPLIDCYKTADEFFEVREKSLK